MRLVIKLCMCLALVSVTVTGQERIRKFMAGPNGDQIRVIIALTDVLEDGYKLQSMIIDMSRIKTTSEQPSFVQVDLTATVRSLVTGAKQQKAFILHWNKAGQVELKCNGKWTKHNTSPGIEKIIEVTKSVVENIRLDAKTPTEVTLSPQLEQEIAAILDALKPENLPCLKESN